MVRKGKERKEEEIIIECKQCYTYLYNIFTGEIPARTSLLDIELQLPALNLNNMIVEH